MYGGTQAVLLEKEMPVRQAEIQSEMERGA